MQRLFRLSFLVVLLSVLGVASGFAQTAPQVYVSGKIEPDQVRVFLKDSVYIIDRDYIVGGTLIIEPGTKIYFYPNGRLIDSTGGRIIADGDAAANYNQFPNGINPVSPGSVYDGYSDLNYFLRSPNFPPLFGSQSTVNVTTTRDLTVHPNKYNYIFNVLLDTVNRRIVDFEVDENNRANEVTNPNHVIVPYEKALMFVASRMYRDPDFDVNLKIEPWSRIGNKPVNIEQNTIRFIGQPVNNFSREWGHIIVLPGARAAFFRNVSFEGFRKDTTVDRVDIYDENVLGSEWSEVNDRMNMLTNGSGGAITTFSSRTWLLDVTFENNMARYRGGALQLLQAPEGFPMVETSVENYPSDKNPHITESNGEISSIIRNNPIPMTDMIDSEDEEPFETDWARQAWDDGRLALYLGRMRNMTFNNNYTQLANVVERVIPGLGKVITDDKDNPADYPQHYGNIAAGGAIYIAGEEGQKDRQLELGLGINNSIMMDGNEVVFPSKDEFHATGNHADNYQSGASSKGARGGALYIGDYTSMIVAGEWGSNNTYSKFLQNENAGSNSGYYSMGGAIYHANTIGRLQVRGGPGRVTGINNPTRFTGNSSGAGGAIFIDGNTDPSMSPIIGGSDQRLITRDYGFDIQFTSNTAESFGGAIFSRRNMKVNGAGGYDAQANEVIGYGGKYPIIFDNNSSSYCGGAISLHIPNAYPPLPVSQRAVQIVRAEFTNNTVGADVSDISKAEIRGGGAIYSLNADLNVIKGSNFSNNTVYNGNGGAIAMIHPQTSSKRLFLTDADVIDFDSETGVANGYTSTDEMFTYGTDPAPDTRMLTRFLNNNIELDPDIVESQSGSGATQVGKGVVVAKVNLFGTDWLSSQVGYAVGMGGTILKLTDGGQTWEYQNSGTGFRLVDVQFVNQQIGYAAGDRGVIVKTTNGGTTWDMLSTPTDKMINDIYFIGTQTGFAATNDGYVLKTTDAGDTWSISQPIPNINLNSIMFNDGVNNGFIVGDGGTILRTTDAGANWNVQLITGLTQNLNEIFFKSATDGIAVGDDGVIIMTSNSGNTWSFINAGVTNNLYTAFFTGQNDGYIAGQFGAYLKSTDGGQTWDEIDPGSTYSFYDIEFPSQSAGFMVGDAGLILGTTSGGNATSEWAEIRPSNEGFVDVNRFHQEIMLPENGVGLGGALYILDSISVNRVGRVDSISFNRVRIQDNKAFTGSALYSDNFDLKLIFNRSLITNNVTDTLNNIGVNQNFITGPLDINDPDEPNFASSDLAPATIYGELQGPLPSAIYSEAANSIYNNEARFLIRLPDAPNTKGILAGTTGIGFGGTDTLRGNYWGETQANVDMIIESTDAVQETFFVAAGDETVLNYIWNSNELLEQGPFESTYLYTYTPIPLRNGTDQTEVGDNSIPEQLLFSGWIYDIYDKGTDIKTADYSNRRMSPIEDFAVGIPPIVDRFDDEEQPSYEKYVRRLIRDPELASDLPIVAELQAEFGPNVEGEFYHPIGYPLYLETLIDYSGASDLTNDDPNALNETVFFVINETTTDFIRVNLKQVDEMNNKELFRARVELVPDSSARPGQERAFLSRRTLQGLANLGVGKPLLDSLWRHPYNEDAAALAGRKYTVEQTAVGSLVDYGFGNIPDIYVQTNRGGMPAENQGHQTYFAGERYGALPVNVGDTVRIVSRTVLWREGVVEAWDGGIKFGIAASTEPAFFTGDVIDLQDQLDTMVVSSLKPGEDLDTNIIDWSNRIFVREDRTYPVSDGEYSNPSDPLEPAGRDSILNVTAIDSSRFWDPRSLRIPDQFAKLTYRWEAAPNSGVERWLMADTIYASTQNIAAGQINVENPKDGAEGYLMFRGRPINPFVVPGGELVTLSVDNYPPHYRIVDSLRNMVNPGPFTQEELDAFVEIFGPYFHAPEYVDSLARYLQQDTIDFGAEYTRNYEFYVHVIDSTPVFDLPFVPRSDTTEIDNRTTTIQRRMNTYTDEMEDYVTYSPSISACELTEDGRLKANFTNKLRFQVDINTDDEMEDQAAIELDQRHGRPIWDFRYGKTAYGFYNIAVRSDDTTVVDTTLLPPDYDWDWPDTLLVSQTRPNWMSNEYFYEYDSDDVRSTFGEEFLAEGKLNIRIDSVEALQLLTPTSQYSGALNTDTAFTVFVNDGHSGLRAERFEVLINVQPVIITESLPDAKEDLDYNHTEENQQLIDTTKMIKVFDPNFGQTHRFELVYENYPVDEIPVDPCFPEAGVIDLTNLKTTPEWLKINSESGLLYGTPRLDDAPKTELVTVVVWDSDSLATVKQFELFVDSTNHQPFITHVPFVDCVDMGQPWETVIRVYDPDLIRQEAPEELTITVYEGDDATPTTKLEWDPTTITGPTQTDTVDITISTNNFDLNRSTEDPSEVILRVEVEDEGGLVHVQYITVKVSEETNFVCPIRVENSIGSFEILEFGTAPEFATTGDGLDGEPQGILDSLLCEFELPPLPPLDVFDVRWTVITTNGTLRNIFPQAQVNVEGEWSYRGKFQAGGEIGSTGPLYPVTISWNKSDVPGFGDPRNPTGSAWFIRDASSLGNVFKYDMSTGEGTHSAEIQVNENGDEMEIVILSAAYNSFVIEYDFINPVDEPTTGITENAITSVSPNPITSNGSDVMVTIGLVKSENVTLEVIDALGKKVAVISDADPFTAGMHNVIWNNQRNDLPAGTYTIRMIAGSSTSTFPVVIVK